MDVRIVVRRREEVCLAGIPPIDFVTDILQGDGLRAASTSAARAATAKDKCFIALYTNNNKDTRVGGVLEASGKNDGDFNVIWCKISTFATNKLSDMMKKYFICLAAFAALACAFSCKKDISEGHAVAKEEILAAVSSASCDVLDQNGATVGKAVVAAKKAEAKGDNQSDLYEAIIVFRPSIMAVPASLSIIGSEALKEASKIEMAEMVASGLALGTLSSIPADMKPLIYGKIADGLSKLDGEMLVNLAAIREGQIIALPASEVEANLKVHLGEYFLRVAKSQNSICVLSIDQVAIEPATGILYINPIKDPGGSVAR